MGLIPYLKSLFQPPPNCEDVNSFLVEYVEGTLPPHTQAAFEAHLQACSNCATYLSQYEQTIGLLKDCEALHMHPDIVEHTLAFLRGNMDRSGST